MANEFKIKKGLIVTGASGGTVVDIQGSQGQLFSVTDDLSGSIFAVSDISGVPIFDVNSSGLSTFDGLVSGITPVNAANFVTKAYVDGSGGGTGPFLPLAGGTLSGTLNITQTTSDFIDLTRDLATDQTWRQAISGAGSFSLYDVTRGADVFTLDTSGDAIFAGDVTLNGEIYGRTSAAFPGLGGLGFYSLVPYLENANQGGLKIQVQQGNSLVDALTLDFSKNATFAGDIIGGGSITIGSSGAYNAGVIYSDANWGMIFRAKQASPNLADFMFANSADVERLRITSTTADFSVTVDAPTFVGDLNGTINTATLATTQVDSVDNDTVATTAYVNNKIQLIPAGLAFEGTWDARTVAEGGAGTPPSASPLNGQFWIVSIDGSQNLSGITDWKVGDWAIYVDNGAGTDGWQKVDNSSVLDGIGTGQTLPLWAGSGTSNTLTDSPITVSGNNVLVSAGLQLIRTSDPFIQFYEGSTNVGDVFADTSLNNIVLRGASSHGVRIMSNSAADNSETGITLDTSYNVGIGTTSPDADLDVHSSINISNPTSTINEVADLNLRTYSSNWGYRQTKISSTLLNTTTGSNRLDFTIADASITGGNIVAMSILSTGGNVGIGTTSPDSFNSEARNLVVNGSGNVGISIATTTTTGNSSVVFADGTGGTAGYRGRLKYGHATDYMAFFTAAAEKMRIDSNGNVGINVVAQNSSATWRNFQLGGGNVVTRASTGNGMLLGTGFIFTSADTELYKNTAATSRMYFNNDEIRFQNAASGTAGSAITWNETMRIIANGNVGIGVTGPDSRLTVSSGTSNAVANFKSTDAAAYIAIADNSSSGALVNQIGVVGDDMYFATADVERMRIDSAGAIKFNAYGAGTLVTDSSGNITVSSGGGAGGPYLPLSAGSSYPLTATLYGTGANFSATGEFGNMLTINIDDISTGENRGLKLNNFSGTPQVWNITAGQTGVDNDKFTVRDATYNINALTIAINGGEALFAGNVVATNILEVAGAATGSPYLHFTQAGTQKAYIQYVDSGDSFELQSDNQFVVRTGGSTTAFTINSSQNATFAGTISVQGSGASYLTGNVGIGTTVPANKLQVNAASSIADTLILKLDGGAIGFSGNNDANIKHGLVFDLCSYNSSTGVVQRQAAKIEVQKVGSWNESAGGSGTKADIVFSTNNGTIATPAMVEKMRITSTGNVGIGTSTPLAKLDIQGTQGQLFSVTDDLSGSIFAVADISGVPIFDVNSSGVSYFDGNVGVGTSSPNSKLHVLDGAAGTYTPYGESDTLVVESATPGGISLIGTGTGSNAKQSIVFGTPSDVTSANIIYDSNNSFLSIGTTTASNFVKFVSGNGVLALTLDASQNATFAGNVRALGQSLFLSNSSTFNKIALNGTDMEIWSGSLSAAITINNSGLLKFGNYGLSGGGTAASVLGLDSSGNVVKATSFNTTIDDQLPTTDAAASGTIVNWSVSDTVTAGLLYVLKTTGAWTTADADFEARSIGMLAIALSTDADEGMLLQGFFYKSAHGFTIGLPLYISNTSGAFTNTRPTGANDYVRIIGYATSANYIYFDPDKTWVQIA